MIVVALGTALVGLGTRRWFPSWFSAVSCLAISVLAAWNEGVVWLPAVTCLLLSLGGAAVQKGLLARRDAFALVWLVAASGTLGIGVLLWACGITILTSVALLRRRTAGLVRRHSRELVTAGVSLSARVSPTLPPVQDTTTIVLWPLGVAAAIMTYAVGGLSINGLTGGEWWTTSSLVF